MADIVNLRQARKRKARAEKDAQAEANRAAFGRTKEERHLSGARKELDARRLEGHRLEGHRLEGHRLEGHRLEGHRLDKEPE